MSNDKIWMGRRYAKNIRPVPAHIENQEQYAGELLTVTQIEIVPVWSYVLITAHMDAGNDFVIKAYPEDRALFLQAGYVLPTARGKHLLTATITCKFVKEYGDLRMKIVTVEPMPVAEPIVREDGQLEFESNDHFQAYMGIKPIKEQGMPKLMAAFERMAQEDNTPEPTPTDKPVYKYHGETVTVFSAIEKGYGAKKIWLLETRASDESLVRIEAWAEVNRMLKAAGYTALPERGAPKQPMNVEVVIEYDTAHNGYRIKHVYPKVAPVLPEPVIAPETVITIVAKEPAPVPSAISEQLAALRAVYATLVIPMETIVTLHGTERDTAILQSNAALFVAEAIAKLEKIDNSTPTGSTTTEGEDAA